MESLMMDGFGREKPRSVGLSGITTDGVKRSEQLKQDFDLLDKLNLGEKKKKLRDEKWPKPKAAPKGLTTETIRKVSALSKQYETDKDEKERQLQMKLFMRYKAKFGEKYNFKGPLYKEPSNNASLAEWKAKVDLMKDTINSVNALPTFKTYWGMLIGAVYTMWQSNPALFPDMRDGGKPLDLTHMDQMLCSELFFNNMDDEVNQIIIEYEKWFVTGPIKRLFAHSFISLEQLSNHNKQQRAQQIPVQNPEQ